MKFLSEVANEGRQKEFQGALPTTISQVGFSEVYGQNPDIDSTALMISTTSWILTRSLTERKSLSKTQSAEAVQTTIASEHSSDYILAPLSKVGITDPQKVSEFVTPRMLKAVESLSKRDLDNDGLSEQNHNEDWMDTVLRATGESLQNVQKFLRLQGVNINHNTVYRWIKNMSDWCRPI